MMVGRKIEDKYPKRNIKPGNEVFRSENLCSNKFRGISFNLHKGELLGIFGLVGTGRTELARTIFGADPLPDGKIFIDGKEEVINKPHVAIGKGIAFITENRKEEGLTLIHSLVENATISTLKKHTKRFFISNQKRKQAVFDFGGRVSLRPLNPSLLALNFSGGNQQKIVIMKNLMSGAHIFIFDEPTKGVDIGSKVEIYTIMNQLLEQGSSIIMISSEIPEVIGMSDRIMTMYEGNQTGIFINDENLNEEKILSYSTRKERS
jgi:ribose transport system ATP-binding protein